MYFCTLERSTLLALMHIAFATNRYATSSLQRRTARLKEYTDWNPRAFQAQRRLGLRGVRRAPAIQPSTSPTTKPDRRQLPQEGLLVDKGLSRRLAVSQGCTFWLRTFDAPLNGSRRWHHRQLTTTAGELGAVILAELCFGHKLE